MAPPELSITSTDSLSRSGLAHHLHSCHVPSSHWNVKPQLPQINTFTPHKSATNGAASETLKPANAASFLEPRLQIAVCRTSLSLAQGDLPQVPGSEGVTLVVKHDCSIDCTEHRNSW